MSEQSTVALSVIIITHNEERNIRSCLASVSWANELIVVDSQSTDTTVLIAKEFTEKVFVTPWQGYSGAKKFALTKASHEWILWLDADERIVPELRDEIQSIILSKRSEPSAYEVARRAYFVGQWIRHCGWYPGYVLRLFRKSSASFSSSSVHEYLEHSGSRGRLNHDLLHFTDDNLFHYFEKLNRYTTLAVNDLQTNGRSFSLYDLTVRPAFIFVKMYFIRAGFLDGVRGLLLSLYSAMYVFVKYAKLKEAQRPA